LSRNRLFKKLQEDVARSKAINRALCQIAGAISDTDSLAALYSKIHQALAPVIDTSNIFIAHYNRDEDSITFPYIVDSVDFCYPKALNVSKTSSLTARVVNIGRPLLIRREEIVSMRETSGLINPGCTPAKIWLGVPLRTVRGIIGVIAVQSYTNQDAYDETDMDVLSSVADMVAIAIERKRMEDALQESEEKFRRIVTSVREGIVSMDSADRMTFVNGYLCEILGYRQEELLGQPFEMVLSPEEQDDFQRRQMERRDGSSDQFERKFRTREGEDVWTIISASPIHDADGRYLGSFGSITNISERKKVETALHLKNIELQQALAQIKTLHGILPICMHCKKIRDDKGYWSQVEVYVRDHTNAEFSHSLCPECMAVYYPEYSEE